MHSDEEYITEGRWNYHKFEVVEDIFGPDALTKSYTSGYNVSVKNSQIISDIDRAIEWVKTHLDVATRQNQSLLNDEYENSLIIIRAIQLILPTVSAEAHKTSHQ